MFNALYHWLYSLVAFLVGLFFIIFGIIGLILPWSPSIRTDIVSFILENSIAISLFGFGFISVGFTLILNIYLNTKRRYYYSKGEHGSVIIDEAIIHHYIQSYWKELFPTRDIPTRLVLKKRKIKILADFPYLPKEERKAFTHKVQNALQSTFKQTLGYPHELVVGLSFKSDK